MQCRKEPWSFALLCWQVAVLVPALGPGEAAIPPVAPAEFFSRGIVRIVTVKSEVGGVE